MRNAGAQGAQHAWYHLAVGLVARQAPPDVRGQRLADFADFVADQIDIVDQPFRRRLDTAVVDGGRARDGIGVLQRAIVRDERLVEIK
ncbi:MAG TPA: hypothetical protein VIG31_10135, partial [Rhodanobacteraceae bacterium]